MSTENAFVILVMGNPSYVIGALATAYSLRLTNTKHKIVCMATPDIYVKYKYVLSKVFDEVIRILYIKYDAGPLYSKKQHQIYKKWSNISFNKWQCLKLTHYNKVCLLDADLIIVKNIDHLFKLPTPVGCFVNYWKRSEIDFYEGVSHGGVISNNRIKSGLQRGFVINGHCVVLKTGTDIYSKFIKFMNSGKYRKEPRCISMVDEVAITKFQLCEGNKWTHIDESYNCVPWKNSKSNPYILHFFNTEKPWHMNRNKWPDLKNWYKVWDEIIAKFPEIKNTIKLC